MCKYCKLKTLNEAIGEKTNNLTTIGKLKDGSQIFEISLNRYVVEKDDVHRGDLMLDLTCKGNGGVSHVKSTYIPIKYCPFCGEEL